MRSSAVEHCLDTAGVTGSIPVAPTKYLYFELLKLQNLLYLSSMIKCFIVASLIASIIFLIIDVIWLSFATKSFYRPLLGDLISDKPVLWAAGLFYILYMFGMAVIVIQPCIESATLSKSLYTGFIFGLVAYGTYNLTNMAVIKDWSPTVVFVDMFWGGSLTAVSATTGIYLAKKIVHFN